MPYKSEKQRRFMHAKHPDIAARWDKEYGGKVQAKKKHKAKKPVKRGT
jgi:hypothetical protein